MHIIKEIAMALNKMISTKFPKSESLKCKLCNIYFTYTAPNTKELRLHYLTVHKKDLPSLDVSKITPFHVAAWCGRLGMCEYLLKYFTEIDQRDKIAEFLEERKALARLYRGGRRKLWL